MHALIFDIDGTLTETNDIDNLCFVEAIKSVLGIPSIDTNWNNYSHVTDQGIVQELVMRHKGSPITPKELAEFEETFLELLRKKPNSLFSGLPGASAFLQLLRDHQIPIAIATGGWRSTAKLKLEHGGINVADIPLATSSDAASREGIMLHAHAILLAQRQVDSFEKVTYFGDASWDVRACENLGWEFIGIGRQTAELRKMNADRTFADYTNVHAILESLKIQIPTPPES